MDIPINKVTDEIERIRMQADDRGYEWVMNQLESWHIRLDEKEKAFWKFIEQEQYGTNVQ